MISLTNIINLMTIHYKYKNINNNLKKKPNNLKFELEISKTHNIDYLRFSRAWI